MTEMGLDQITQPPAPVETWLYPKPQGLWCEPGQFYIDPRAAVDRAVITHGHADHARPGHGHVLATAETIAIMKVRYGAVCAQAFQPLAMRETIDVNGVRLSFAPAGHILGSAQVVLDYGGQRAVVSGDYKRSPDPTCEPFEAVTCDVFVTEATFGLPVFRHEKAETEILRLIASVAALPDRAHLVGVYGLGKCQRLLKLLRLAGFEKPIYLHTALVGLTRLYEALGQDFGDVRPVMEAPPDEVKTALVLCPPSAVGDRWSRRFTDPVTVFASGWMRTRGRVRQSGVELPLVISDHADWPELIATIIETGASDVWVTHGRDDALVRQMELMGIRGRALALVGREDEDD